MQQPVVLPDGLADLPPGPELGALLAGIDPTRVANHDTVTVLQAWRRQRSHSDAAELAILAEVGHCDPFAPAGRIARLEEAPADCGLEIAAALTLTEVTAWREYALADTLIHRLPAVHASLTAGNIDRAKAMLFADYLEPLTDAQNARICAALLPPAPDLTTGQLRARLRRMVLAIDPEAARRRYRKALQQRRLVCYLDEDGTATLTATGLDPTAAQAACERVDGLAREVRAAGHPEPLPAIRADLSTALQDGSLHTLSHDEIIAVMLARATAPDPETGESSGTGTDAATGTGSEFDSATGTGTGTGSDTGAGTETATGAHHDAATGTGEGSDHDSDSNSGTDTNADADSDSASCTGTDADCDPGSASGSATDTGTNAGTGSTGIAARHGGSREHSADSSDSDDSGRSSRAGTEADGDTDNPGEDDDATSPGASGSDAGGDTSGAGDSESASDPAPNSDSDSDSGGVDGGEDDGHSDRGGNDNGDHPGDAEGGDNDGPDPDPGPDPGDGNSGGPHDDGPDAGGPSDGDGGGGGPRGGGPGGGSGGGGARPIPERARPGIEIRLRLSTLLGHDDHPGEIPGLGPIPAHIARDCLARQQYAEWRFAITDADGYLVLAGTTRRRPPRPPGPGGRPLIRQAHGGTVELQVPATLLEELAVDPPPGWGPLIADLAAQYADRATLLAELDRRSGERFPHPALRRHVEVRDRTCVFPGCRRPARKAQQDHTDDHQYGGPTTSDNLGPLCVFHHAIKTAGRWRVRQPVPGVFRWRSPLGRFYTARGEPVCPPLPDPLPGPEAEVGQVEAVPGLGSPLQAEFDERPLFPTPPEEPEPEEPEPEEPAATSTEAATPATDPESAATDRAPPDEPPF
ncbi:protein of unknown function [Pseudonocardia ammonioxydans]|uniref:HNH nuclease domain-containing protein n=2 Tax=Pseudonocardia ammonioxydans TaxID=260086 RepID=A0A1I5C5W9_PSUAM|nr:protein of unknown function [Pseudonocardia ammonioxydans]